MADPFNDNTMWRQAGPGSQQPVYRQDAGAGTAAPSAVTGGNIPSSEELYQRIARALGVGGGGRQAEPGPQGDFPGPALGQTDYYTNPNSTPPPQNDPYYHELGSYWGNVMGDVYQQAEQNQESQFWANQAQQNAALALANQMPGFNSTMSALAQNSLAQSLIGPNLAHANALAQQQHAMNMHGLNQQNETYQYGIDVRDPRDRGFADRWLGLQVQLRDQEMQRLGVDERTANELRSNAERDARSAAIAGGAVHAPGLQWRLEDAATAHQLAMDDIGINRSTVGTMRGHDRLNYDERIAGYDDRLWDWKHGMKGNAGLAGLYGNALNLALAGNANGAAADLLAGHVSEQGLLAGLIDQVPGLMDAMLAANPGSSPVDIYNLLSGMGTGMPGNLGGQFDDAAYQAALTGTTPAEQWDLLMAHNERL